MGTNGFFGSITGPFEHDTDLFPTIQEQCSNTINYISKLGIQYVGNFDLDLKGNYCDTIKVRIGQIVSDSYDQQQSIEYTSIQIGRTRMLELQDVKIVSIQFEQNMDDRTFIDYQYVAADL